MMISQVKIDTFKGFVMRVLLTPDASKPAIPRTRYSMYNSNAEKRASKPKRTIDQVREEFSAQGFTVLDTEYGLSSTKVRCLCPVGHECAIAYHNFRAGTKCRQCSYAKRGANRKLDFEQVKRNFQEKGYTVLSEKYENALSPLKVVCPHSHIINMTWATFQQGRECRYCVNNNILFTHEQARQFFAQRGYTLLAEEYKGVGSPMDFVCDRGHQGKMSLSSVRSGRICRKCAYVKNGHALRNSYKEVREAFEQAGYKLLTDVYTHTKGKLPFVCPNGHYESMSYSDLRRGTNCRDCYLEGLSFQHPWKHSYEAVKAKFEAEKYKLISQHYQNTQQKLEYICPKDHSGTVTLCNFVGGARCMACYRENSKKEGNPHWNPNKTDEERADKRKYFEYNEWRLAVFRRDDYKCAICSSNKKIEAHHLNNYRKNPELRTLVSNGVTVCRSHHIEFHKSFGYRDNTKEDFDKYLAIQGVL